MTLYSRADAMTRTAAQVLVDQLRIQGVRHVFCVPGESYLAVLDALYDSGIDVIVCRNEGGASMMAEAYGKATGRPGICFVTRGPGATNGSGGIHIARQDSTPMILFVGQVETHNRGRDAFQEMDYRDFFGGMAKWVAEIDEPDRMAEHVGRAFATAMAGRPGPVVLSLPHDVLPRPSASKDVPRIEPAEPAPVFAPPTAPPPPPTAWATMPCERLPTVVISPVWMMVTLPPTPFEPSSISSDRSFGPLPSSLVVNRPKLVPANPPPPPIDCAMMAMESSPSVTMLPVRST